MINNDKILENMNAKIESLSSSIKNQLSFNKMIETQLTQIAATLPNKTKERKLKNIIITPKNVKAMTTRGGKSTRDPPNPNHSAGKTKEHQEEGSSSKKTQKDQ